MKQYFDINSISFVYFLSILIWAPIPLGSNRVWAWSLLEALVYGLAVLVLGAILFQRIGVEQLKILQKFRWILLLFSMHLVFLLIQCFPLPYDWVANVNTIKASWYDLTPISKLPEFIPLTASVNNSIAELHKQIAYLLFFCLSLVLVDSRKRLFITLAVIIIVCVLEAVYGVTARLMGKSFALWRPTDGMFAGGTFVNKNHFGSLLSLGIGLTIGLILYFKTISKPVNSKKNSVKLFLRYLILNINKSTYALLGVLLILLSGVAMSNSRGVVIALILALISSIVLGLIRFGWRSLEGRIAPYLVIVSALAIVWAGGATLVNSFLNLGSDTSRITHWGQAFTMFTDHWLVGVGNGAFQYVFTQYKAGDYAYYLVDFLHNDHLQLFTEQGILGAVIWYLAIASCGVVMLRTYFTRRLGRRYQRLLMGVMFSCLAFFLHGFVEFNFHIPANALWFYTLLGLGLVIANRLQQKRWNS